MYEFGAESGRYYSLNVPLKDGINDHSECIYLFIITNHSCTLPMTLYFCLINISSLYVSCHIVTSDE